MAFLTFTLIFALFAQHTTSLQVTPNSPCSSLCVDSTGLDFSDSNSSNTRNSDISCYDTEYSTSPAGKKFQKCMSCLQDSTFAQGAESDQLWFLYNLRYTFDYCIFGFPNATGVASTPCATSTACGGLMEALTDGDLKPEKNGYSYCSSDGMPSAAVSECKACVAASDDQDYLANFLIALDAGCQQRPPTGSLIGLNDTVFSKTKISSVDPSIENSDDDDQPVLSVTQIVGIAVGAVVLVLAIAGFLFVRCRRRRNQRLLLGDIKASVMAQKRNRHRTASTLSFRCQAHLTPRSPSFFPNPYDGTIEEEKPYTGPFSALASHPAYPESPRQAFNNSMGLNSFSKPDGKVIPLHNITTAIPTIPSNVHYSTSPKAAFFSPTDEPASTTSTKSTAQLLPLRQYNPAEYTDNSPQTGTNHNTMFNSPTSGSTASPLISRAWERSTPAWDALPRNSSRPIAGGAWERVAAGIATKNRRTSNTGSPVETKQINFNFPPPPTGR
ncbi:hypothetical protein F4774DRAFT_181166 [Daldinia eschscholtzii]|nr:hypothetical protein F4774DRAFT_181166 [Daldinia eschscholtzii]